MRKLRLSKYVLDLIAQRSGEYVCSYSGHAIYMHFARKMEKLGYKGVTFHDLRHINASVMLFLGVPTKYAQERGGWATDYTLKQVYQSTFSEQRDKFDTVIDNYFENIYTDESNNETKPSE
jgi:integrase